MMYAKAQITGEKENDFMAKSKLVQANEKIAEGVVSGYKKIEEGVVDGYKKIEQGAVEGFNKMSDKFVDSFLTKEGESVEDAKVRLKAEQKEREEAAERKEEYAGCHGNIAEESMRKAQEASAEARKKAGLE